MCEFLPTHHTQLVILNFKMYIHIPIRMYTYTRRLNIINNLKTVINLQITLKEPIFLLCGKSLQKLKDTQPFNIKLSPLNLSSKELTSSLNVSCTHLKVMKLIKLLDLTEFINLSNLLQYEVYTH